MKKTPKGYRECIGCLNILGGGAPIVSGSGVQHLELEDWRRIDGTKVNSIWIKYCFVCGKPLVGKYLGECNLAGCSNTFVLPSCGSLRKYCCANHRVRDWQIRKAEKGTSDGEENY